ncbi:MAG: tetratricopeptide repeat protein [Lentisphaerae bacterium]|nr:tetratricopeptide repeat protein [Lentisphaerota bacterium]
MKKFITPAIILLLFAGTFLLHADSPVRVSFRPAKPEAGERVHVTVTADSTSRNGAELILPKLPGKAQWNYNMRSDGSQMSFSNNGQPKITYRFVRQLITGEAGKLEIPPFQVRSGREILSSPPTTLEILPPNTRKPENSEEIKPFGKFTTSPDRPVRSGEKINFNLEIFIPENYQLLNFSISNISNSGNAVLLKDPRSGRPIRQHNPYTANINDHEYTVYPFSIAAKTGISGEFFPETSVSLELREVRKVSRDESADDFFDSFFNRSHFFGRPQNLTLHLKDSAGFKVIPLPALPAGVYDLGLSGKWQISAKLNAAACRSGEVAELEITAIPAESGISIADTSIRAPEFDFENFRRYPPEIIRKNGRISIRYALIPLNPGEKILNFKLGSFNPASGQWEIFTFALPLAVTPGSADVKTVKPVAPKTETAVISAPETPANVPVVPGLHYLKSGKNDEVKIPLIGNSSGIILFFIIGGVVIVVLDTLLRRFSKNFSPARFARRRELRKRINVICDEIKNSSEPEKVLEKYGFAEIAELSGLPAGATAQDIADHIDDTELKEFFNMTASSGFAPGATGRETTPELRAKLLKFLKKLALILCLSFLTIGAAAGVSAGITAYNRGDSSAAAEEFRRELHNDRLSPGVLYNLGCTAFQQGKLPEARVWFTRALRLSPGDAETAANLRAVEEKLQLTSPEDDSRLTTQLAALRDSLCRPDQYLAWAAGGFFLLCILFAMRGRNAAHIWRWSVAGVVLFCTLTALLAAFEQSCSSYSASRLILTGKNVEIRSLPMESSGTVLKKINPGGDAVMIEKRNSWLLIHADGTEGWIREDQALQVFPYGIL